MRAVRSDPLYNTCEKMHKPLDKREKWVYNSCMIIWKGENTNETYTILLRLFSRNPGVLDRISFDMINVAAEYPRGILRIFHVRRCRRICDTFLKGNKSNGQAAKGKSGDR